MKCGPSRLMHLKDPKPSIWRRQRRSRHEKYEWGTNAVLTANHADESHLR